MITLRRANERGHSLLGWLDSRHTFSFGEYYDSRHMGFRSLRVLNEDFVGGGHGFDMHSHRDYEIVSYIVDGSLAHRDSMGHHAVVGAGEVQRLSAGSGIAHSEYNHSPTAPVHLLQVWLTPAQRGLHPDYVHRSFSTASSDGLRLVCSGDGSGGSIVIHLDAAVLIGHLPRGAAITYDLRDGRAAWVQLIDGGLLVNQVPLAAGDGVAVDREPELVFQSSAGAHFLLFDLA